MLESKDRRILSELQADSRLTMQELGERTGMSSSACWRRVKSLEEAGIIDRYAVVVNRRKAGFGFSSVALFGKCIGIRRYSSALPRAAKPIFICASWSRTSTLTTLFWTTSYFACPAYHKSARTSCSRRSRRIQRCRLNREAVMARPGMPGLKVSHKVKKTHP